VQGGADWKADRPRPRHRSRSASRGRPAAKPRAGKAAKAGTAGGAGRPGEDAAKEPGNDHSNDDSLLSAGAVVVPPAGAGAGAGRPPPGGRLLRRAARLVLEMTLTGWDMRLNTRTRLGVTTGLLSVFLGFGVVNETLLDEPCAVSGWVARDATCTGAGAVAMVAWTLGFLGLLLASFALSLPGRGVGLARRLHPYTFGGAVVALSLQQAGYTFGGMSVLAEQEASYFTRWRAIASFVYGTGCGIFANSGVPVPAALEAALAVVPGAVYSAVCVWYNLTIEARARGIAPFPFADDWTPPTPADTAFSALLVVVFPAAYLLAAFAIHGGPMSLVNGRPGDGAGARGERRDAAGRAEQQLLRSTATVVSTWGAFSVLLLVAMYGLLAVPVGVPAVDVVFFDEMVSRVYLLVAILLG